MFKRIILIIFLLSAFFTDVEAFQVKAAKDNETLFFKISLKEYSRIFVTGDRIISAKGKNNYYEIKEFKGKNDEGVIYIRPFYQSKPFSIFITTEGGHHFTLLLVPMNVPSENIEIKPLTAVKAVAEKWESNLPYLQSMIVLIREMINGVQPEGYAVIQLGKTKPKKMETDISLQLLTIYRGGLLQGEIWKLKNEASHSIYLNPRQFYQNNIRAISITDEKLNSHAETLLYRIVSHE